MQMTFRLKTVLLATTLLFTPSANAGFLGEDAIYTGVRIPTKGAPGLPKTLKSFDQAFTVSDSGVDEASNEISNDIGETDAREPASVSRRPPVTQKAKSKHWSSSTTEGFEFKIRVKQQVSAVWVMKRGDHFDFIFANNAGSRVNLSLPAEQFYALKNAASDIDVRAPASEMLKCKDSFMELEMVETGTRKAVATCLNTKSKSADELRRFGSALTSYIR